MGDSLLGQIIEIWVLYVIGIFMIGARICCRTKLVGFRNYELDDYLIVVVGCIWTAAPAIGQVFIQVAKGRHTSNLTTEQREAMSEEERDEWAFGSQMFLFGLTGYFLIVWLLKINMLCFYSRIVRQMWTEKLVKPAMALVIASLIAIALTIALRCRPFHHYWQVWPDPGPQCAPQNSTVFILILSCNLFTDVCIMLIPIPVIIRQELKIWKRLGLYFLFTLGFFCMFAAVLRFVLIYKLNERGVSAMWSLREDCVAIFVGQAPLLTPLLCRNFWADYTIFGAPKKPNESYNMNSGGSGDTQWSTLISSGKRLDPHPMSTLRASSSLDEPANRITVYSSIDIEQGPRNEGDAARVDPQSPARLPNEGGLRILWEERRTWYL